MKTLKLFFSATMWDTTIKFGGYCKKITFFRKIDFFFESTHPPVPKYGGESSGGCFGTVSRFFCKINAEFSYQNIRPTAFLRPDLDSTQNFDLKYRVSQIYRSNLRS